METPVRPGLLRPSRVISVVPGLGSFYISSAAQTTISTAGTAVKMSGTTTAISTRQFAHASNRLTYEGQRTSRFIIMAVVSLDVASADDIISVQLFKNGSLITGSEQRSDNTSAKPTNIMVMIDTTLAVGDYVEIWIENEDTTANIDVTQAYMTILGIMGE
jgi:adenylate cyclase class IV